MHSRLPSLPRQASDAENQVNADVPEAVAAQHPICLFSMGGIMSAVHPFQDLIIEGLYSHTDSGDAEPLKRLQILLAFLHDILRIDLKRKLQIVMAFRTENRLVKTGDDALQHVKRQHRWGTASYI